MIDTDSCVDRPETLKDHFNGRQTHHVCICEHSCLSDGQSWSVLSVCDQSTLSQCSSHPLICCLLKKYLTCRKINQAHTQHVFLIFYLYKTLKYFAPSIVILCIIISKEILLNIIHDMLIQI